MSFCHPSWNQLTHPKGNQIKQLMNHLIQRNLNENQLKKLTNRLKTILLPICYFSLIILANNAVQATQLDNMNQNETTSLALPQVTLATINAGQLLFTQQHIQQNSTLYYQAPELKNTVNINIQGIVANAHITQEFVNTTNDWQHALYVFPLPDDAAVNALKITIDEREIIGLIKENSQAKAVFTHAKSKGKKAALLEQIRPNLFSIRVANIPPKKSISVELTYFQKVQVNTQNSRSIFRLNFPMAITPRYMPKTDTNNHTTPALNHITEEEGVDIKHEDSRIQFKKEKKPFIETAIPNSSHRAVTRNHRSTLKINKVTQPTPLYKRTSLNSEKINTVNFTLTLDSASPLENIKSLYHSVILEKKKEHVYIINMPLEPLNKDFELVWTYQQESLPKVINFNTQFKDDYYGVLMLFPSILNPSKKISNKKVKLAKNINDKIKKNTYKQTRQLTFIIDKSGSMSGLSMQQAKLAFKHGLHTLESTDTFQLITFNNEANPFFIQPVIANEKNKNLAWQYVSNLQANGGTNISNALSIALFSKQQLHTENVQENKNNTPLEQIIFLTDGAVGNEAEIFTMINKNIQNKRLFTVGLGSAPNRYFMKRAAEVGRGSYQFIGDATQLVPVMTQLFHKLNKPVLTDISFTLINNENKQLTLPNITTSPNPIPDLYAGDPIFLSYKIDTSNEKPVETSMIDNMKAMIRANYQGESWQFPVSLKDIAKRTVTETVSTKLASNETTNTKSTVIPAIATLWAKHKIDDHYSDLMLDRNQESKQAIIDLALQFNLVTPFTSFVAIDKNISKPTHQKAQNKQLRNNLPVGQRMPKTALNWQKQLLIAFVIMLFAISVLILCKVFNKPCNHPLVGE